MTGEWLTYVQIAERLGVSRNAARQRAIRGRWQRTLGNDQRTRIRPPDGWEHNVRTRNGRSSRTPNGHIPAKLLMAALEEHIGTLKAQLIAAETRSERLAADFAAREAKHAAELATERTLADQMSARVDQLTADLTGQRATVEKGLRPPAPHLPGLRSTSLRAEVRPYGAKPARVWWKPFSKG